MEIKNLAKMRVGYDGTLHVTILDNVMLDQGTRSVKPTEIELEIDTDSWVSFSEGGSWGEIFDKVISVVEKEEK